MLRADVFLKGQMQMPAEDQIEVELFDRDKPVAGAVDDAMTMSAGRFDEGVMRDEDADALRAGILLRDEFFQAFQVFRANLSVFPEST